MDDYREKVGAMSLEKALTTAAYGESVAAYRYRMLSEKPFLERDRDTFVAMADEEHGHHNRLAAILKRNFPGSDFVLTPEDKEIVIVGPRTLEVPDRESFQRALNLICESERLTGRLYATLRELTTRADLKPFFKEMADECLEHVELLLQIPPLD